MRLGRRLKKSKSRDKKSGKAKADVGRLSADFILTTITPKIEKLATNSIEKYANEYMLYEEAIAEFNANNKSAEAEVGTDGTILSHEDIPMPPKKPLFHSEYDFNEFKKSVLEDVSDHFYAKKGGWRVQANAAKFERQLDEKYGVFRGFITSHPEVDVFLRSVQRKYAMGYFSPFRQSPPPISRGNAVILLFMMHRGKTDWQITLLTGLFLLIGLQPWALVGIIVLVKFLFNRRKHRNIGMMKTSIALTEPYYKAGPETATDSEGENRLKREMLLKPVGKPLDEIDKSFDITNTSGFDAIMLGSGPATLYCAALLSRAGRRVLLICPRKDASGCLTMERFKNDKEAEKFKDIPFDVNCCNISKISRQQAFLAPALCSKTDYQGGVRFAKIGSVDDGHAFEILAVPGLGTDSWDKQIPFVLCADGAMENLTDQAAEFLGDGWRDANGGPGHSTTCQYVEACEDMNLTSSEFYLSKLLSEGVNKMRNSSTYHDCAIRHASSFLNRVFPLNVQTRSLMAAIGMKSENIRPSATSMAAHVSNVVSTINSEGMHYPIGGPRSLSHALATVIEQSGGRIVTETNAVELIFDESIDTGKPQSTGNKNDDAGPPPPCCVGVKLENGKEVRFSKERYNISRDKWPVVVSMDGFIHTFIRLLPDEVRTKYKVPRGLPALSEKRPIMHILFALKGNADDLELTGADYYRLPAAAVTRDELDPVTGQVKFGEIGFSDEDGEEEEAAVKVIESLTKDDGNEEEKEESKPKENENKKKKQQVKFTSGLSWMRVSFPSAKDPSFESRHGKISTCVVSIEADDDFTVAFETKPKIFVIKKENASTSGNVSRLFDRVKKDLLDIYPQLEGKIEHAELHGPYHRGLRQNPERYAAKGIRPDTPYPGLHVGGSDLTVDTTSGSFVAAWLVANSVSKYQPVDHLFLAKYITTDIEQFIEQPLIPEEEDIAVPLPPVKIHELKEDSPNE